MGDSMDLQDLQKPLAINPVGNDEDFFIRPPIRGKHRLHGECAGTREERHCMALLYLKNTQQFGAQALKKNRKFFFAVADIGAEQGMPDSRGYVDWPRIQKNPRMIFFSFIHRRLFEKFSVISSGNNRTRGAGVDGSRDVLTNKKEGPLLDKTRGKTRFKAVAVSTRTAW